MANLKVADNLALPLDTVTSTLVVYGGKGMGKTNFGAVLVEELKKAGQRFSVVDPVGVWHGLQHSADGKQPGIEVLVLGGAHGDLPIEPTAGVVVADLVADEEVDVVIDVSRRANGTMWSQGEKIRFIADYCSRLYERQGERRRPLHQVIDEAGRFVPQQIPSGALDIARCVGAIEQLVELGRNVGVGVTLITQRSARMNKSVSELADCMIAFRTVGPRSIDAILDWFGEHVAKAKWAALLEQLRALPVGTALVVSPGWLGFEGTARMRPRETFDSSATPKPGAPTRRLGKAARPDLPTYQQRMAATIERAKADDPKTLRARIVELERQIAAKPAAVRSVPDPRVLHLERELTNTRQEIERLRSTLAGWLRMIGDSAAEITRKVAGGLEVTGAGEWAPSAEHKPMPAAVPRIAPVPAEHKRTPPRVPAPRPEQAEGGVSGPQQRILNALADLDAVGISVPQRGNVAVFADQSPSSSGYANNLSALRTRGLIDYPTKGGVSLTEAGRRIATATESISSLEDLHAAWQRRLSGPQWRIIGALLTSYPNPRPREEVAEQAGQSPTSSGYANNLSALRTLGLLDYPSKGEVVATELLFPAVLR